MDPRAIDRLFAIPEPFAESSLDVILDWWSDWARTFCYNGKYCKADGWIIVTGLYSYCEISALHGKARIGAVPLNYTK